MPRWRPTSTVIAPWREWDLDSRTAPRSTSRERHDIPVPVTTERPYSTDRNLFHISYEGGILEDPWTEPPPKMFLLTNSPESAPDVPVYVEIEFEEGNPGRGGRPAARRPWRCSSASTGSAASTASAASTWWRTASWA